MAMSRFETNRREVEIVREVILKFVVSLLLGRKKQYFKVVRVKERNVLITIEEYIPANELLKKMNDDLHACSQFKK